MLHSLAYRRQFRGSNLATSFLKNIFAAFTKCAVLYAYTAEMPYRQSCLSMANSMRWISFSPIPTTRENSLPLLYNNNIYPLCLVPQQAAYATKPPPGRGRRIVPQKTQGGKIAGPIMQQSSYLRDIVLPSTWKGKLAARYARHYWKNEYKRLVGKEPPPSAPGNIGPLMLSIDDRPSIIYTEISPQGIKFDQHDHIGRWLWKFANPTPWSKKSRWVKWPAYTLVAYYASLLIFWLLYREEVPITGRQQFRFMTFVTGIGRDEIGDEDIEKMRKTNKTLLSHDDPLVLHLQTILDRILSASGLAYQNWRLLVLHENSKSISIELTLSVWSKHLQLYHC